jgi:hypothetical protein
MAFGGTPGNVNLGVGRLWYAPLATTEPTSPSAALPSAWQAIGYTAEGTSVKIASKSDAVEVAEELDPIRYVNTSRTTSLSLSMVESTRKRLALAIGMGAGETDGAHALEPPDSGAETGFMLVWDSEETAAGNSANIRWIFRQCKATGTIDISRKKAPNKVAIPVEINCEKPNDGSKTFKVYPNASGLI